MQMGSAIWIACLAAMVIACFSIGTACLYYGFDKLNAGDWGGVTGVLLGFFNVFLATWGFQDLRYELNREDHHESQ